MALVCDGHPLYDDYLVDDIEKGRFFSLLEKHFPIDGKTYDLNRSEIERALRVTEFSLLHLRECSEANRDWLISFAGKIPSIKQYYKKHLEKSGQIQALSALFLKSEILPEALSTLSIYLTPARRTQPITEKKLTEAKHICAFMVDAGAFSQDLQHIKKLFQISERDKAFPDLYDAIKTLFNHISDVPAEEEEKEEVIVHVPPPDLISKIRKGLKKIKNATVDELDPEIFYKAMCEMTLSQESRLEETLAVRYEHQEAQLQHAYHFCHRVATHYWGKIIFKSPRSHQVSILFSQRLQSMLPVIGKQLFIQEPRPLSSLEKELIVSTFASFEAFIKDFTDRSSMYETIRKKLALPAPFTEQELQKQILDRMERIVAYLAFDDKEQNGTPSHQDQFFQLLVSPPAVEFLNRLLHPDVLSYTLHRFLECTLWEKKQPAGSAPLSAFPITDEDFSAALGTHVAGLLKDFLKLGSASGPASWAGSFVIKLIERNKILIGDTIQKKLMQLTSSECMIEPIRILDLLLFDGAEPAATAFFALTAEQRAAFRTELRAKIDSHYLPQMVQKVKELSKAGGQVLKLDSIKAFSRNVIDRLWLLTQDEALLKALAFYLLDGVQTALRNEHRRKEHDRHYRPLSSAAAGVVVGKK